MKTIANAYLALTLILLAACQTHKPKLTLEGTINRPSGTIYLQSFHNKMFIVIDSATITDGVFSFSFSPERPDLFGLTLDPSERFSPYFIFLDSGTVHVDIDVYNPRDLTVEGSSTHNVFADYRRRIRTEQDSFDLPAFLAANPSSVAAAYILYRDFSYRLSKEEIDRNLALLSSSLDETEYVSVLKELSQILERVAVGQPASDFSLPNVYGDTLHLSEFIGKGYLLLDFWASWCPPCRRENPNLVALYRKYHDKGFDIFAVSLDEKRDSWLKAISDDNLTWTHVSDLAFWNSAPAHLYGVRAIPSNVLIAPDGTIVARNLRGEELAAKLAELIR
jgi:peroxiredoxin